MNASDFEMGPAKAAEGLAKRGSVVGNRSLRRS
jgi:hypothetical protein